MVNTSDKLSLRHHFCLSHMKLIDFWYGHTIFSITKWPGVAYDLSCNLVGSSAASISANVLLVG